MLDSLKKIFRRFIFPDSEKNSQEFNDLTLNNREIPILLSELTLANHTQSEYEDESVKQYHRAWEVGDWEKFSSINLTNLESHPQRVDLALLKGAALLQLGDTAMGKEAFRKASEWGANSKLVSKILIAGTHRNLGKANRYIGNDDRSLDHFNLSADIITGGDGTIRSLSLKKSEHRNYLKSSAPHVTPAQDIRSGPTKIVNEKTEIEATSSNKIDELLALRKSVESIPQILKKQSDRLDETLRLEITNLKMQLESFIAINNYLTNGEYFGNFHGFPISPDIGLYMVQLLEENSYNAIVEFGSGTSTTILARASSLISTRKNKPKPVHVAFEHLEQYFLATKNMLENIGLEKHVDVQLAHLLEYFGPNKRQYRYYACEEKLYNLNEQLPLDDRRILVVVDGPPGSACKNSRYPAVPIIVKIFTNARIDILLDDYNRQDEKEIATEWLTYLDSLEISTKCIEKKFEKGAYLISLQTPKN